MSSLSVFLQPVGDCFCGNYYAGWYIFSSENRGCFTDASGFSADLGAGKGFQRTYEFFFFS